MLNIQKLSSLACNSFFVAGLLLSSVTMTGCDLAKNTLKTDRSANKEFQDYRDAMASRIPLHEQQPREAEDNIPDLQPYVAQPSDNLKPMPLVSISVNQTVPLRDVLFELAKQADYDVEIDPRITGSIIFTAKNRPFDTVVKRISEISGLRYKFDDDVLRVELDSPYTKTYNIDYLSYVRTSTSSIRNDISVVTGSGANTGSGFEASSESVADFWKELTDGMQQILGVRLASSEMRTDRDPQVTAVDQNPAPVEPVVTEGADGESEVQVQPPQATLQVNTLPTDDTQMQSGSGDEEDDELSFSVNKQAGIISVYAPERLHKEIDDYLKKLKRSVTSQVLIEAKVLEVALTDEYSTGINWSQIDLMGDLSIIDTLFPTQPFLDADAAPNMGTLLSIGGDDVNVLMQALQQFGTVRALASPRLTVLNNQSAVLNVAQNLVYFEIDIETTRTDGGGSDTTIDSEIRNVPEGVLINVQPSINLDDQMVSMAIRPTITNVEEYKDDPGVAFAVAQIPGVDPGEISNSIPVVQVQEFDSVINMHSGEAVLMGGLMQDRHRTSEQGVPVLADIPLFGGAFKSHVDKIEKTELVVFLKATIVDGSNIHNTDRELYKMFSQDRRPLDL